MTKSLVMGRYNRQLTRSRKLNAVWLPVRNWNKINQQFTEG